MSQYFSISLEYNAIERYKFQEDDIKSLIVEIKMHGEVYKVCFIYRTAGSNFENLYSITGKF